jgi:hypothetical protein
LIAPLLYRLSIQPSAENIISILHDRPDALSIPQGACLAACSKNEQLWCLDPAESAFSADENRRIHSVAAREKR